VLLEDLDPNHACLGHHIKIWADRYHAPGETKGGQVPLTFETLLITSQYTPEEIFTDQKTIDAVRRRFKFIHI